ncbi:MAG: tryptophan-rich sensory protein [Candidatus Aenigmarchaeota archaeon]|nr:tryptophan-rich sensory protein [Candidatus Aenigmarchaeota archaeon]
MDIPKLVATIAVCLLIGALGSVFTAPSIGTWYASINKPSFNPPNWIFGPVWIMLFLLMGVSAYLVWEKCLQQKKAVNALYVFGAQLALNFLWSVLFFGLHKPLYALIEISALWAAIAMTIMEFRKYSRTASMMLLPYLAWVTFAAVLNYAIVVLN